MTLPQAVRSSNQTWSHLPPTKDPPSPLNQRDFNDVKFWTKSSWNVHERAQRGATNGNAKKTKKRGRPEKETPDDDCDSLEPNTVHIYLETEDGVPVSKALITQQGQKIRSLWATLGKHGLAPMVWSEADSLAVKFVDSAMLNDPRFHYLRLCDDNWKIKHWISKNYPSWVRNHLAPDGAAKAKKEALDDENLFKISPDPSDNELKMTPDLSDVISHAESSDALEDIMVGFFFLTPKRPDCSYIFSDAVLVVVTSNNGFEDCRPTTVCFICSCYWSRADTVRRDDDEDEGLDDQTGMPTGYPEATTTQSPTSEPDLYTVPPTPMNVRVDKALAPTTTVARKGSVLAPATVDGTLLSTSTPPSNASLTEGLPQFADGPTRKKQKVAAPAVVSNSISDK
jgi:hypothetical protein